MLTIYVIHGTRDHVSRYEEVFSHVNCRTADELLAELQPFDTVRGYVAVDQWARPADALRPGRLTVVPVAVESDTADDFRAHLLVVRAA